MAWTQAVHRGDRQYQQSSFLDTAKEGISDLGPVHGAPNGRAGAGGALYDFTLRFQLSIWLPSSMI